MVQQVQQHQPIAKMYAQVHVSHYSNIMPYPHVFSPVYVPPMAMPGYFSNAAYPHPPNGSNCLLIWTQVWNPAVQTCSHWQCFWVREFY
ncbi:hypothetical protein P3S68_009114 [Capsicum galapagoense]